MKSLISSFFFFAALSLLVFAGPVFAQNGQKQRLLLVQSEKPLPDKISEYEAAQKAFNEFARKNGFNFDFSVFSTDNDIYYFVMNIEGLAGIDKMNKDWADLTKRAGKDELAKVMDAFRGTVDYNTSDVYSQGKYSYNPKNPKTKPEEIKFYRWTFYDLKPYYDQDGLDTVLKEMKDFCEKNNIDMGYDLYYKTLGGENNQLVTSEGAKSQVDYYASSEEWSKNYGEKFRPLWEKFLVYVKDYHGIDCWYRPDLSLTSSKSQELPR